MYIKKETTMTKETTYSIYAGKGTEGCYGLTRDELVDIKNGIEGILSKDLKESDDVKMVKSILGFKF